MRFFPHFDCIVTVKLRFSLKSGDMASFMTENCIYAIDWRSNRKKQNMLFLPKKKLRLDCHYVWHNNGFAIKIQKKQGFLPFRQLHYEAKLVNSNPHYSYINVIFRSDCKRFEMMNSRNTNSWMFGSYFTIAQLYHLRIQIGQNKAFLVVWKDRNKMIAE